MIAEKAIAYGQPVMVPEAPAREGYTFDCWKEIPSTMPAHDITVEGVYIANTYRLSYFIDDMPYETENVPYGATITPEPAPVKEGYTFKGWLNLPVTMPAHDVQVIGDFTINSYKATFKVGEVVIAEKTIAYGQTVLAPEAPAREGYTFDCWNEIPFTMPAHDIAVEGVYIANTYRLSYFIDGMPYESENVPYGATITPKPAPVKEGYTFKGWLNLPATMPAHDVQVTSDFTINSYKVTFTIGEDVIAEKTIVYGQSVIPPEPPVKEGCSFNGWNGIPALMPACDLVIEGEYTVNTYHLVVYVNDELYMDEMVKYGETLVISIPKVPENWEFKGWNIEIPSTMPANDLVIRGSMVMLEDLTQVFANRRKIDIYDINGYLMLKGVTMEKAVSMLKHGLYIVNGMKVILAN